MNYADVHLLSMIYDRPILTFPPLAMISLAWLASTNQLNPFTLPCLFVPLVPAAGCEISFSCPAIGYLSLPVKL